MRITRTSKKYRNYQCSTCRAITTCYPVSYPVILQFPIGSRYGDLWMISNPERNTEVSRPDMTVWTYLTAEYMCLFGIFCKDHSLLPAQRIQSTDVYEYDITFFKETGKKKYRKRPTKATRKKKLNGRYDNSSQSILQYEDIRNYSRNVRIQD